LAQEPAGKDAVTHFAGTKREDDNYILSPNLPVELGVNRVLLRAGTGTAPVRLTATTEGLPSATITIPTASPAPVVGGLSRDFPEAAQRGLLTRGPTPVTPNFRVTRSTAVPASVVAGSGTDATATIDDNELTRWASDGKPTTAWIEYRFSAPVTLSEIELKLVGWRSRAYPLRISIDGLAVWEGTTDRSLGYVGLPFAATRGSVVRITQTAPVTDRDAFGKVIELNNARAAGDTGADAIPPGWRLGIVEADFHGPAPR